MKTVFAAVTLALCGQAFAADGNYIATLADAHDRALQGRGTTADGVDAGKLVGFVIAVTDDSTLMQVVCLPSGVTYEQLVEVAKKSTREKPDQWHLPGHLLVQMALMKSFPCKK